MFQATGPLKTSSSNVFVTSLKIAKIGLFLKKGLKSLIKLYLKLISVKLEDVINCLNLQRSYILLTLTIL
jgi:hypothetical protein